MANVPTLSQVLQGCTSPNNDQRKVCEAILDQECQKQGINFVLALLREANGNGAENRLAAVMSRRILGKEEQIVQTSIQSDMRQICLQILSSPHTDFKQKQHICDIVECMLALEFEFPELETFLKQTLNATDHVFQLTGLHLARMTIECRDPEEDQGFAQFVKQCILTAIAKAVQNDNLKIILAGLRLIVTIIQCIPDRIVNAQELNPIQMLFQGLNKGMQKDNEKMCTDCLELIVELAKSDVHLFQNQLDQVLQVIQQVASNSNFSDDMRSQALEVLVQVIQSDPVTAVNNAAFVDASMALCFALLAENSFDEDWGNLENTDTFTDMEELQQSAEVAIFNIVNAVDESKELLSSLMSRIQNLLNSEHWAQKHAGLVAIYQCIENLEAQGVKFSQIIDLVAQCAKDPNNRVRFSACQCVGIMCSDYSRGVNSHAQQISEILSFYIEQDPHPRVRTHALLCWNNFFEAASPKCIIKSINRIMKAFQTLLSSDHAKEQIVQENLCAAIAELCSALEDEKHREAVVPYFDSFMQVCIDIVKGCSSESLLGEALRTMSYLGVIGGKAKFSPYVEHMMTASSQLVTSEGVSEEKLFNCWSRISRILEDDFGTFLEDIIRLLVEAVQTDVVMVESITRGDSDNVERGEGGVQLDANKIQLVTSSLELLEEFAKHCPNSFKQYIPNLVPLISERMQFKPHRGIRESAIDCLVTGFCHCCIKVKEHAFVLQVVQQLLTLLRNDEETKVKSNIVTKLYNLMEENKATITSVIGPQDLQQINSVLLELLGTMNVRIQSVEIELRKQLQDDFTEEELKDDIEAESTFSSEIASYYHLAFKLYGSDLLKLLSDQMAMLQAMLEEGHVLQQVAVLNIFADIISLCNAEGIEDFAKTLIPAFSQSVKSNDPDLRESAFYIISSIIDKFPQLIQDKDLCQNIVQQAFEQFSIEDDKGNYEAVQDAATASIIKVLMQFDKSYLAEDAAKLYKLWLDMCFPLRENEFSGRQIFDAMCKLLEQTHPPFIGNNFSNLPSIFTILIQHHGTDYMSNEADQKVVAIFGQLRRGHENLFMKTVQALDEDSKLQLQDLCEGTSI